MNFWIGLGLFAGGALVGGTVVYMLYYKIESRYEAIHSRLAGIEQKIKNVL